MVLAITSLLTALVLPALSNTKAKAKQVGCLNNLKELALCLQSYAADNDSKLPENLPGNPEGPGRSPWVRGNMRVQTESTNALLLRQGRLFPYLNQTVTYRCPADLSSNQGVWRVRSYSMNGWVGSRIMERESHPAEFRTFVRDGELAAAGPSRIWTLIDEHETSINDGWFQVTMDDHRPFASFPADRHDGGYGLSFADGHVETMRLRDPGSRPPGARVGPLNAPNADWLRLKQLTTTR